MKPRPNDQFRWTIPNLLTGFRFLAAPVLLGLAWAQMPSAFLGLLAVVFLTDLLDGMTARMLGQVSRYGAILDSWADVIVYLTVALSCWWLWPDTVRREKLYVLLVVTSCLLPAGIGYLKFRSFTSYHTRLVKLAAASMAISLYILFFGGSALPFHVAAIICVLAALEEIAMTLILPAPQSDIRSIWLIFKHWRQADLKAFFKGRAKG